MAQQSKNQTNSAQPEAQDHTNDLLFKKQNYIIVLIGIAIIALGLILMIGGGSTDPDVFNPAMFDFRHLTLAPILILIGFVVEFVAIFRRK